MSRPQRRRKYVDPPVQGSLARRIVLHWLVLFGAVSATAFLLQVLSNPFQPLTVHLQNLWWTQGPLLVVLLFMLPMFVVDTVKLSHRFAGPIVSLRRAMREVAEGQPPRRIQFRATDFWQELAKDYNAMLSRLAPSDDPVGANTEDEQLASAADVQ